MHSLIRWDHEALAAVRRLRRPWLTVFFKVLTQLGAPWGFAVLALTLWGIGTPFTFLLLRRLAAAGVAWLVVEVIKRLSSRRRPDVVFPEHVALIANPDVRSFPSGHTATTVAAAVAFAGVEPRVTVVSAVLATLIAFSRVYLGVHFPLDVLAGGALGAVCGLVTPMLLW